MYQAYCITPDTFVKYAIEKNGLKSIFTAKINSAKNSRDTQKIKKAFNEIDYMLQHAKTIKICGKNLEKELKALIEWFEDQKKTISRR